MFISPSGRGLKILVSTPNLDPENYYHNLQRFGEYLSGQYQIYNKYIDPITYKHVSFISYDPNCFFNPQAKDFLAVTTQREISLSDEEKVKIVKLINNFTSKKLVYKDII